MECPKCHSDYPSASRFCSKCGTQIYSLSVKPHLNFLMMGKQKITRETTSSDGLFLPGLEHYFNGAKA
jgi:hypothetical protein